MPSTSVHRTSSLLKAATPPADQEAMRRMPNLSDERGFTLIELIVVILIIGILAAVALPAFLSQRAKAQDGAAKADARSMVSAMEACYTEVDQYDPCPDGPSGVSEGTDPGQVLATPSGDEYTIVSFSKSGNTFTVVKNADGTTTRSCLNTGTTFGGCEGGTW